MKTSFLALALIMLCSVSFAQKANVTWGDEFKLKKGSTDLDVMHTDNTGVYVKESHFAMKSYFVIGATLRESATLTKLYKDLKEIYTNNFNKELKGKEYESFFFCEGAKLLRRTWLEAKGQEYIVPIYLDGLPYDKLDTVVTEWTNRLIQTINK